MIRNKNIWVESNILGSNARVDLNIGDFIQYWIFIDGIYEKNVFEFLRKNIGGKILLDLGSNIGTFPLSLFDIAKHVYAFDASVVNCNLLERNLKKNKIKNVTVVNKAIYEKSGKTLKLYLSKDAMGNHNLFIRTGEVKKVSTVSLDDFVKSSNLKHVDLIKIDIEGSELTALRGASFLLKKIRPTIIIEFNRYMSNWAGYELLDLFDQITKYRYAACEINGESVSRKDVINDKTFNRNLVFTPL